ncbi:hypothetical protein CIK05_08145 [Bdellovibrio sp. qaytius]|nr:hypothetical protein CIK05_08145 [Bdellovibrio sp. qaytius]
MKIAFSFLIITLVGVASFANDLTLSEYASIAKIEATQVEGLSAPGGAGTGFLIEKTKGLVLTNIHVIATCFDALGEDPWKPSNAVIGKSCPPQTINITFLNAQGQPSTRSVKILAIGTPTHPESSMLHDWVLLQIDANKVKNIPALKASARTLKPGESIRFAGFPASPVGKKLSQVPGLYTNTGQILATPFVTEVWYTIYESLNLPAEQFSSLTNFGLKNFMTNPNIFFHDALIIGGYSGSPVFDEAGYVVGLLFGNASAWNYNFGDYPEALGADASKPDKLANKLSMGVLFQSICETESFKAVLDCSKTFLQ